ncbi:hypothetical protein HNP32_003436 [Brevundimonas bullata]|uniref:Uncharacterized protein n=1 Tax=Brevundimonas bullata TaxID=13160 RepID=A0A7W7ISG4_9CAUL|nr:hypothetical protein [Brevundimonas bullata]MBB4799676.1 hypothetical protein [Brevundimonas bullata]MBB6384702.1 hypothetical protein [Brevundimonas bullata]
MTTMLERAARAVNEGEAQWGLEPTGTRSEMIARAVLMAVRCPTTGMRDAIGWSDYDILGWVEGIDSILNEGAAHGQA